MLRCVLSHPGDLETPYVFEQVVVGGAVPKNYFPAVEKGLQECVQKGPLAAYPVVGVKATLYDGSYPSGRFLRNGIQDGNQFLHSRKALWMHLRYFLSRSYL